MTRPCSDDLRERVVAAMRSGESCRSMASRFGVAPSSVAKWTQRAARPGSVSPAKMGIPQAGSGAASRLVAGACARLRADVQKKTLVAAERTHPDVKRRRGRWQRYQGQITPRRLVFIDETWVKTNMAPLRGWAGKGERLPGAAPFGHWNTSTFIAALRYDRIDAPWVFDGPVNGDIFEQFTPEECENYIQNAGYAFV